MSECEVCGKQLEPKYVEIGLCGVECYREWKREAADLHGYWPDPE